MNRRALFRLFGAALATAALDPEKLLWVPPGKLISIPAANVYQRQFVWPMEDISMEEMEARYFRSAAEAIHQAMLRDYEIRMMLYAGDQRPRIGETINLRRPQRFNRIAS
jgi:hypothetical protein